MAKAELASRTLETYDDDELSEAIVQHIGTEHVVRNWQDVHKALLQSQVVDASGFSQRRVKHLLEKLKNQGVLVSGPRGYSLPAAVLAVGASSDMLDNESGSESDDAGFMFS